MSGLSRQTNLVRLIADLQKDIAELKRRAIVTGGGPTGPAGGALSGTFPNPSIATGAVTNDMLSGSINNSKLLTNPLARANHTGTQLHTTISDFDAGVQTNRLDQMAAPTTNVFINSQIMTGINRLETTLAAGDKLLLYSNLYGIGIESGCLTNWSGSVFRWRIGGSSVSTGTEHMVLNSTTLDVKTKRVISVSNPTGANDAANKDYVDNDYVGWTVPSMPTAPYDWFNYGGGHATFAYRRDKAGRVHLRGLIKTGTIPGTVFLLPAGFRPQFTEVFGVITNGAIGRVDVLANGEINVIQGSSTYVTLAGISFQSSSYTG